MALVKISANLYLMFLVVEGVVVVRGVVAGVPVEDELALVQSPDPFFLLQLAQVAILDGLLLLLRNILLNM